MSNSAKLVAACASGVSAALLFACGIDVGGAGSLTAARDASVDAVSALHADVSAPPADAHAHNGDATIGGGADDGEAPDALEEADAGEDAAPEAAAPVQCGGGVFNTVQCTASQTCCATSDGMGGFAYACIPHASQCGGIPVACAKGADCGGGDVCCDHHNGNHESVQCMTASACGSEPRLCDPFASDCPAGQLCLPYGAGIPYSACR